jgi:aminopeptidase N
MECEKDLDTLVLQLQDSLTISEVSFSRDISQPQFEELVNFQHTHHALYVDLPETLSAGDPFYIRIMYGGKAGGTSGFFSGITSKKDSKYGFDVTYTLSEPHNAKDWFPVKQVLEDKIDSAWISLECADHLMAASNGLLTEIKPVEPNRHVFKWRTNYPIAYYLLSLAVADYRDFSFYAALSSGGDSVLVQNYVYDTDEVMTDWEDEIRATGPMISSFSTLLMDYPFAEEKYGHAMAPMGGGMEHQTMTTIQGFNFFLVAHELAHQWFGDYITCGNWQDIWINEGFASYMEYVAAQELLGQESADDWMENAMSIALREQHGSVHVPAESVNDTYRLFDYGLSYKKGAILLHMIRFHLNDDNLFFSVLRSYLEQYGMGLAEGEDFREVLESESEMDFSCFFDQWYYGEGFPRFSLYWTQLGDSLMIRSEQTSSAPDITPFFTTPFELEIRLSDGTLKRVRLMQDEQIKEYSLAVEGLVVGVSFDPDNWLLKTADVIRQMNTDREFVFGPNPVTDELHIQFMHPKRIDEIVITNLNGQELIRQTESENPVIMNLESLVEGTYLLVMQDENRTYLERIVKVSGR